MPKDKLHSPKLASTIYQLFDVAKKERIFLLFIAVTTFICALVTPYPQIAMWVGFALAAYAVIANDSVQTIGTFMIANGKGKWYLLWLFVGLIFVGTVLWSWLINKGDVSSQRLLTQGLEKTPTSFVFLQIAAPILLLILTRMRMPVSTTLILLSCFAYQSTTLISIIQKSFIGYGIALSIGLLSWLLVNKLFERFADRKQADYWVILQWLTSGTLWALWLIQDVANIAVYLPRSLSMTQFIGFSSIVFLGLGFLFYFKQTKVKEIVAVNPELKDVRGATVVDFIFLSLLLYFTLTSTVPMSTTWVFFGLLAGRSIAESLSKQKAAKRKESFFKGLGLIGKNLFRAFIGLVIGVLLAIAINENIRKEIVGLF